MYKLRCLGSVDLRDDAGTAVRSVLSQPKRVALLVFLATQPGESASREQLLDVFWPELDPDRGRRALSQALYYLRRSLGKRALVTEEGDRVHLAPDQVECDLHLFRKWADDGACRKAMDCLRGDFMEGFTLPDLPTFDSWLEDTRSEILLEVRDLALSASSKAQAEGDPVAACQFARKAVELAPLEERPLRRLLEALQASGDRGRALALYREFRARLKEELDVEPSRATRELAASLLEEKPAQEGQDGRLAVEGGAEPQVLDEDVSAATERPHAHGADHEAGADHEHGAGHEHGATHGHEGGPGDATAPPGPRIAIDPVSFKPPPRAITHRRAAPPGPLRGFLTWLRQGARRNESTLGLGSISIAGWSLAFLAGLAIAVFGWGGMADDATATSSTDRTRVAVLPFSFQGSESYSYLGSGVAELLNISLAELRPIQTVDPQALRAALTSEQRTRGISVRMAEEVSRRFGADLFITGSVIEFGGKLEVIAYLHDGEGALLHTLRANTTQEMELFQVVDDLVRGLVALEYLTVGGGLGRTAAVTTHSQGALRSFLEGEELYRRGEYQAALQALEQAVAADSTFALAHYRAALSTLWMGSPDFDSARQWIRRAQDHMGRLPEQERNLIQALDGFLSGSPHRAEALYRQILAQQPENVEAWFNLGEVLFHYGPVMGRSLSESREAWERVLEVQPDHRGARFHSALVAASEGRVGELVATLDTMVALDPEGRTSLSVHALAAWAADDRGEQLRVLHRARYESDRAVHWAVEYLVRYLQEVPGAIELVRVRGEHAQTREERLAGHLRLALLETARGRPAAAEAELAAAARIEPEVAGLYHSYLVSLPETGVELRALAASGGELPAEDPPGVPPLWDAAPRLSNNDLEQDPDMLQEVRRRAPQGLIPATGSRQDLHLYLEALTALQEGEAGAQELREIQHRLRGLPSDLFPLASLLAGGLESEEAVQEERLGEATTILEGIFEEPGTWYEETRVSPLYTLVRERMTLASLLRNAGDGDGALRWYGSLTRSSLGEAPFMVPSWIRRAEIHEARGEWRDAAHLYRRVMELWEEADPDLSPIVAEARARLEARVDLLASPWPDQEVHGSRGWRPAPGPETLAHEFQPQ